MLLFDTEVIAAVDAIHDDRPPLLLSFPIRPSWFDIVVKLIAIESYAAGLCYRNPRTETVGGTTRFYADLMQ